MERALPPIALKDNVKPTPSLVIAAALDVELEPFRKFNSPGIALLKTGMGVINAKRNLRSFLRLQQVRAVLNVGLAGALSPNLNIGDLVIVRNFLNDVKTKPSAELRAMADKISYKKTRLHFGDAFTVDKVIWKSKERRDIAKGIPVNGCAIFDMESSAVAETCGAFDIPFMIIRSISDQYNEDLPINFNKCLKNDGNLSITKIIITVLTNPRSLKGLLELRKRSLICTENLTSFVHQLLLAMSD